MWKPLLILFTFVVFTVGMLALGLVLVFWPEKVQRWVTEYMRRHPYPDWMRPFLIVDEQWLETKGYLFSLWACGVIALLMSAAMIWGFLRGFGVLR